MSGGKANPLCRIILNNVCRYSVLKDEYKSPFLKCGLGIVMSFQKGQHGNKGRKCTVEEPQPGDDSQQQQGQVILIVCTLQMM